LLDFEDEFSKCLGTCQLIFRASQTFDSKSEANYCRLVQISDHFKQLMEHRNQHLN